MNAQKGIISLLFVGIFGITFLPFNLWHHHAEDEHFIAQFVHQKSEHHCDLDDQFCQPATPHACDHGTHVAKAISHCFVCDFHFIKQVDAHVATTLTVFQIATKVYAGYIAWPLAFADIRITNKGPPAFSSF